MEIENRIIPSHIKTKDLPEMIYCNILRVDEILFYNF